MTKSKSLVIRESLEKNPNVIIVGIKEENNLLKVIDKLKNTEDPKNYDEFESEKGFDGFSSVDFYVSPKEGLYAGHKLQDFMMGLIPKGLTPKEINDFCSVESSEKPGKYYFDIGRLYFSEIVGSCKFFLDGEKFVKRNGGLFIYDEEMKKCEGLEKGELMLQDEFREKYDAFKDKLLKRRIGVYPFPTKDVAKMAINISNGNHSLEELLKHSYGSVLYSLRSLPFRIEDISLEDLKAYKFEEI